MGAPYGEELRLRALAAFDEGMSKWQVHKTFKIARTTLDAWLKLRETSGGVQATTHYHRGLQPVILDNAENQAFFETYKYKTLAQLCEAWLEKTGIRVSDVTMSKALKRLGYTRKKRASTTKSALWQRERPTKQT